MFELSEMIKRNQGSERAGRKLTFPPGTIRLDIGEPDFPTPPHIREAAIQAIRDHASHYVNPYGDPELREEICRGLERDYGARADPAEILVTTGGIMAIHLVMANFLDLGDEVLIPDPEYSAYAESVRYFGGTPVYVPLTAAMHLDPREVEERVTARTKAIILSNPGNPTGQVLTEKQVRGLADIALRHNLILVVDEVYGKLIYGGRSHVSIIGIDQVRDRAILVNSFSKTYAMTGWRIGYILAPPAVIDIMARLHKSMVICANAVAQRACVAALTGPQDCVEEMRAEYDRRRTIIESRLSEIDRVSVLPCHGAFYSFPRVNVGLSSVKLAAYLSKNGIQVRSGSEYGLGGQNRIRMAFTISREQIEQGMERLKTALDRLD